MWAGLSSRFVPMHISDDLFNRRIRRPQAVWGMPGFVDADICPGPDCLAAFTAWRPEQIVPVQIATGCTINQKVKFTQDLFAIPPLRWMRLAVLRF